MALLYQAGSLKMSTWIALAWGFLYAMFYVLESFSTVSSLL